MKKVIIIVAVVCLVLFLAKDFIAGTFLTVGISSFTDLPASVEKLNLGVFKSAVDVKGFKLGNPKRVFKDRVMMDMPELYINYDLGSFLSGTKHLREVKLYIKEFDVIKNDAGELNLDSLKAIQTKMGKAGGNKGEIHKGEKKEDFKFKIDVLELKIDKVVYKDYSGAGEPQIKEFNVGINERYTNITNPYTFASLVVFKALSNTRISSLANLDLGPLQGAASDALSTATKTAADTVSNATQVIKDLLPFGK